MLGSAGGDRGAQHHNRPISACTDLQAFDSFQHSSVPCQFPPFPYYSFSRQNYLLYESCVDLVGFKYPRFPSALQVEEPAGVQTRKSSHPTPIRFHLLHRHTEPFPIKFLPMHSFSSGMAGIDFRPTPSDPRSRGSNFSVGALLSPNPHLL